MNHYSASVIITCFNNSLYIRQCIESVLMQQNVDIEVIIVDDCSTDNSILLIMSLCKDNSSCLLLENTVNIGVAASRNRGLSMATKPFISFLDGDDYYINPLKIYNEIFALHQQPKHERLLYIAFSPHLYVDSFGKPLHGVFSLPPYAYNRFFFLLRLLNLPRDFVLSTQLAKNIGGFDESLNLYEDWDFKIRLIAKAKFILAVPSFGSAYRRHFNGLSKRSKLTLFAALTSYFIKNCTFIECILLFPFHVISFFIISPISSAAYKFCGQFIQIKVNTD